jgi:hypothetical protein
MRRYLWWGGGLVLAVVLAIVLAAGLVPQYEACQSYRDSYRGVGLGPETTSTPVAPEWYVAADCQGVENDLQAAFYFVALGAALVGIGFVVR